MGGAKRLMEEMEDKRNAAIRVAIEAGALEECEHHDGSYSEGGDDVSEAIRLGEELFEAGEFKGLFEDRDELTDLIQQVVEELADPDGCQECGERFGDD